MKDGIWTSGEAVQCVVLPYPHFLRTQFAPELQFPAESLRTLDRATVAIDTLGRTPLAGGAEQPRLALAPLEPVATDDEPNIRLPFARSGDDR